MGVHGCIADNNESNKRLTELCLKLFTSQTHNYNSAFQFDCVDVDL